MSPMEYKNKHDWQAMMREGVGMRDAGDGDLLVIDTPGQHIEVLAFTDERGEPYLVARAWKGAALPHQQHEDGPPILTFLGDLSPGERIMRGEDEPDYDQQIQQKQKEDSE